MVEKPARLDLSGAKLLPAIRSELAKLTMSYARKNIKNVSISIAAVVVVAAIGIWQFYQFVTFKAANGVTDPAGGTVHLWLAIAMAVFASIAGLLVFSVFLRHDSDDDLHITQPPASPPRAINP
jgi:hypothetical protein